MVVSVGRVLGIAAGLIASAVFTQVPLASAGVQSVSEVQVEEAPGLTRVILHGARDPLYTAFMLSEPPRLLVDLPDVVIDGPTSPIEVNNGLVSQVTVGAFGDPGSSPRMARVSIGLLEEAEYEVVPSGDRVIVEIRARRGAEEIDGAMPPMASSTGDAAGTTAASTASSAPPSETARGAEADEADPAAQAANNAALTRKKGGTAKVLRIVPTDGGVNVRADGALENVEAFVVHDPERLVVDLWGSVNAETRSTIPVDDDLVQRVRVGQHPDKVRVVLDLAAPVQNHTVEPTEDGLRIWVEGSGSSLAGHANPSEAAAAPAPDDAENAAADPEAAPERAKPKPASSATSGGTAHVASVHFESYDEVDRVVVTLDRAVQPIVADPDPATVVVDLPGARIGAEAERRVDTREFGGPVELVSVFQTPDIDHDQVRVVVKRNGTDEPRLQWDGSILLIEFPRGPGHRRPGAEAGEPTPQDGSMPDGVPPAAIQKMPGQGAPGALEPVSYFDEEDLYSGPSEPASIDILREGGFTEEKEYQGRRVSLDFKDADIGNILRLIADVSDLNIIAGEEVQGTVTVRLVEVPWDQALDVILMTKGLGFTRIGKVLRIAPLDILKQEEEQRLQERRARERLEDLAVKLQPVSYASVKELEKLIKKLLSPRGTVNIDKRTNTLIIKDIPSVINEATALVKAIDTQTPQVLIEAKIVEANLNFSRSLGAVFGIGYNPVGVDGQGLPRTWQGGAPDFHLGDGSNSVVPGLGTIAQQTNFVVSNPIASATGLLTMGLLGVNDHLQLDLQLQAAEANTKAKVISSPRVVTLDNSEAKILQGTAIKFVASDGDNVNTSFVDAVLELRVTPHITADRTIIMAIKVSRNAPRIDTATGEDTGINKNEADTELLVLDGQTAVLGGIYVVEKSDAASKVPFLADIPLLGTAFKNKSLLDERRELLIFVTPRIVRGMAPAS